MRSSPTSRTRSSLSPTLTHPPMGRVQALSEVERKCGALKMSQSHLLFRRSFPGTFTLLLHSPSNTSLPLLPFLSPFLLLLHLPPFLPPSFSSFSFPSPPSPSSHSPSLPSSLFVSCFTLSASHSALPSTRTPYPRPHATKPHTSVHRSPSPCLPPS